MQTKVSKETAHSRRSFLRNAAISVAALQLGRSALGAEQAGSTGPAGTAAKAAAQAFAKAIVDVGRV